MNPIQRILFLIQITHARAIARRYIVTNGFDGALTMLGLLLGFFRSGDANHQLVLNACVGAAVALAASGLSSAYISESAEKRRELQSLEAALVSDLRETAFGRASRWVPVVIALINGLAPLGVSLLIMLPIWLSLQGFALPLPPLLLAMAIALGSLFLLGAFLGQVSQTFWLWSGIRTLLIALATGAAIYLLTIPPPAAG